MWWKYSIKIPDWAVEKYALTSNLVSFDHIGQLHKFQEGKEFKIAPNIRDDVFNNGPFAKMRVAPAKRVLSRATTAGLRILVTEYGYSTDMLTTAIFCEYAGLYFDLFGSRSSKFCFTKGSPEKFEEYSKIIREFLDVIRGMVYDVAHGGDEKPVRNGLVMSTHSMGDMIDLFLDELKFPFLLGSRFTTDALENHISQIRRRYKCPTGKQTQQAMKCLMVVTHMKLPSNTNYPEDSSWLQELSLQRAHEEQQDPEAVKV